MAVKAFVRPKFSLSSPTSPTTTSSGALVSLPDLLEFDASHNPTHPFCLQYTRNVHESPHSISCADLHSAVLRCSTWLSLVGLAQVPEIVDGQVIKPPPVAILMASDIGWLVSFLALLRLGVPVLCLSTRLAPQAVVHLIRSTEAQAILVSPQTEGLSSETVSLFHLEDDGVDVPSVHLVPSYSEFLDHRSELDPLHAPPPPRFADESRDAVILHSSGTTGLPKPIFHSHAYLLGYAACHTLSPKDVEGALNVSTLPLFHGFGLLAPSLALSIGLPFAIPAASSIPTGTSTLEILRTSSATSLMTVPSILEELYLLDNSSGVDALRKLRFVAVGGAPMKHGVAEPLADAGVPILNHWGVTEIGAIAPIFVPRKDYDWHYLRVRDDIRLRFERVEDDSNGEKYHRLIGCPPGTQTEFVVQDLLTVNPKRPTSEFRIAGRADDLIVLATGEKVRPTLLEQHVSEDPLVKGAVAFGDGKFQLGLIIEVAAHFALNLADESAVSAYVDSIWPSVAAGNENTDKHGRVSRDMIIVTTFQTQPLLRTPKGSIPRGANVQQFKDKVDALYLKADVSGAESLPVDHPERLRNALHKLVQMSFNSPRSISNDDDFFEHGMDSLQATILRRRIVAAMTLTSPESPPLPLDIVYRHSSVTFLADAIRKHCHSETFKDHAPSDDRITNVRAVMQEYVGKVISLSEEISPVPAASHSTSESQGAVVLLTGSTGSLGSALLAELVASPDVSKVFALNRRGSRSLRARQEDGLGKLGSDIGTRWCKVELLEVDFSARQLGLDGVVYSNLQQVTHIIHNAWPMDFNRSLTSFRPHLEASLNVIRLVLSVPRARAVRVLFSSSIAVVGRYPIVTGRTSPIAEAAVDNPAVIDHFGYAEAKWVCERMFQEASRVYAHQLSATSVRIGQMTGADTTGAWNTAEHFPMIVKSCATLGKIPHLEGTASWIPVNKAAHVMTELIFHSSPLTSSVVHLENPARQQWSHILSTMASELGLASSDRPSFEEWLELVQMHDDPDSNPCAKILPFLKDEFIRMATGQVVLDTTISQSISSTLANSTPLSTAQLQKFVAYWRKEQFIATRRPEVQASQSRAPMWSILRQILRHLFDLTSN